MQNMTTSFLIGLVPARWEAASDGKRDKQPATKSLWSFATLLLVPMQFC